MGWQRIRWQGNGVSQVDLERIRRIPSLASTKPKFLLGTFYYHPHHHFHSNSPTFSPSHLVSNRRFPSASTYPSTSNLRLHQSDPVPTSSTTQHGRFSTSAYFIGRKAAHDHQSREGGGDQSRAAATSPSSNDRQTLRVATDDSRTDLLLLASHPSNPRISTSERQELRQERRDLLLSSRRRISSSRRSSSVRRTLASHIFPFLFLPTHPLQHDSLPSRCQTLSNCQSDQHHHPSRPPSSSSNYNEHHQLGFRLPLPLGPLAFLTASLQSLLRFLCPCFLLLIQHASGSDDHPSTSFPNQTINESRHRSSRTRSSFGPPLLLQAIPRPCHRRAQTSREERHQRSRTPRNCRFRCRGGRPHRRRVAEEGTHPLSSHLTDQTGVRRTRAIQLTHQESVLPTHHHDGRSC